MALRVHSIVGKQVNRGEGEERFPLLVSSEPSARGFCSKNAPYRQASVLAQSVRSVRKSGRGSVVLVLATSYNMKCNGTT